LQVSHVIISGIRDLRLPLVQLSVDLVKASGGKILEQIVDGKNMGEKVDIPGIGIYVKCEIQKVINLLFSNRLQTRKIKNNVKQLDTFVACRQFSQ